MDEIKLNHRYLLYSFDEWPPVVEAVCIETSLKAVRFVFENNESHWILKTADHQVIEDLGSFSDDPPLYLINSTFYKKQ